MKYPIDTLALCLLLLGTSSTAGAQSVAEMRLGVLNTLSQVSAELTAKPLPPDVLRQLQNHANEMLALVTPAHGAGKPWAERLEDAIAADCTGRHAHAATALLELAKERPSDGRATAQLMQAYYNAGIALLEQRQPWDAIPYFDKVRELSPHDGRTATAQGKAAVYKPGQLLGPAYDQAMRYVIHYRRDGCL